MPRKYPFNRTCLAVALGQALALPAHGALITVNSSLDDGDGGNCTLREAIASANADSPTGGCSGDGAFGTDTIDFDLALPATITLSGTQITINSTVTIDGPGQDLLAVNGNGDSRVFLITGGAVTLNRLTITGGMSIDGGGGFRAFASSVFLTNSTVSGNSTYDVGGGIYANTGASVSLTNSTVSGNSADDDGGGIFLLNSSASLTNSTVSGNSAGAFGGGISAVSSGLAPIVDLTNTTISGNSAPSSGGGISASTAIVNMNNSTVWGNSAGDVGGGVYAYDGSSVSLTNSIVSGNVATSGDEIGNDSSTLTVDHYNLFGHAGISEADAFSGFTPGPGDFNATTSATTNGSPVALTNILGTTLADNGGPTLTHALVPFSPALNNADPAGCGPVDQRGAPRGADFCDIGAFEAILGTLQVDSDTDGPPSDDQACTLRESLLSSNSGLEFDNCIATPPDSQQITNRITFNNGLSGFPITWTSAPPTIVRKVSIEGLGADQIEINGGGSYPGFLIDGTEVEISHLAIRNAYTASSGAGMVMENGARLLLTHSEVSGSTAAVNGGGIHVFDNAALTVTQSRISNNFAGDYGGGISLFQGATLSMYRSTLEGNSAGATGGGIMAAINSSASLTDSTLVGNSAGSIGGGIMVANSSADLSNSTLSGNFSDSVGAGVGTFSSALVSLANSTLSGNSAGANGGGIANGNGSSVSLTNSMVSGNTATMGDEIHNFDSTVTADHNNLFGHGGISDIEAFSGTPGFTPGSGDISATSDGTSVALTSILDTTLADNGGPTLTHALVAGSPAINAADNAACPVTDQRGETRDVQCDIGSFEFIDDGMCFVVRANGGGTVVFCL